MNAPHKPTSIPETISLPQDNDRQSDLRAQFEREGRDAQGNPRMGKIAEYAGRVHDEAWALLKAPNSAALRFRLVDSLSKEELARELFANGTVRVSDVRRRVAKRYQQLTNMHFDADIDGPVFKHAAVVIRAYVEENGEGRSDANGL